MNKSTSEKPIRDQDGMWEYFQTDGASIFDFAIPRLAYLLRQAVRFANKKPLTILNIGIGNAWLELQCKQLGWLVVALDPVHAAAKLTGEKGIWAVQGSIETLPFPTHTFDVVFCSEVLEHLHDGLLESGMHELKRILKPTGLLLGTVPFEEPLINRITVCPQCGLVHHAYGHHQSFTQSRLKQLLNNAQFLNTEFRIRAFPGFVRRNFTGKLKSLVWVIVGRIGAQAADSKIVFFAKP